jgi:hypothetical protein
MYKNIFASTMPLQPIYFTILVVKNKHDENTITISRGSAQHSCKTPIDLDLYPHIEQNELAGVNSKYKLKVGYWASSNGL